MKITNLGVANTALPSQLPVEESLAGAGASTQGVAVDAGGYTHSTSLVQLIYLVKQQPDVREESVQAAAQRLRQGAYHTQASAERTAAAMLNGLH